MAVPELPEVETVVRDLARLVVGARIRRGAIHRERNLSTPDAATFATAIAGRRIVGARRRAKWIILDLDRGLALLIHLRMTGQVLVLRAGGAPDPYVRATLELADGREIRFRDVRAFGRLALVAVREDGAPAASLDPHDRPLLEGHGAEPLDPAFDTAALRRLLGARRGRLKPLLLDQRLIAGIGNIYADEALWRARLHPLSSPARLSPAQWRALRTAIVRVLGDAVASRGASIDDYTAPDGDGSMQEHLNVYQRTGEPCPRCGTAIRRIVVGGRGTHLCPRCQPAPRGAGRTARAVSVRRGPRWADRLHPDAAGATAAERAAARRRAARGGGSGAAA